MKIQTFQDALSLVPKYLLLTPSVDKWKEGDEVCDISCDRWEVMPPYPHLISEYVHERTKQKTPGRRPIPQSVREAEAYLYLLSTIVIKPGELTRILNSISTEGLRLVRKDTKPLLNWVAENRE